ncbi:11088_t:CDS:2 [Ambispora leptoticha]|uniref:11088_t:CDS:1 n=1 Tax=Ambispora leptoticha TaxID=144679 RepID=A0A9N9AHB2_9GLOM|nr:11088_t:CDS:2 [Ambispora leptoticha]
MAFNLDFLLSIKLFEILTLTFLYYIFHFYFNYYTRKNPLPGPFPLPIIGNLYLIRGDLFDFIQKNHQQYGDLFELWVPNRNIYFNNVNQIGKLTQPNTKSSFTTQMKLTKIFQEYIQTFGFIILNDDYESWRYYRKLLEQTISNQSYQHSLFDVILECFGEIQGHWKKLGAEHVIDIREWALRLLFDILIRTTTGENLFIMTKYFNHLTAGPKVHIAKEIDEMGEGIDQQLKNGAKALFYFQYVPEVLARTVFWWKTKKYLQISKKAQSVYNKIIEKRKQEIRNEDSSNRKVDVLNLLLNANLSDENESPSSKSIRLSDQEISIFLFEIINTSILTTSNTFAFTVEHIERNKKVKEKLLEELKTVFGDDKNNISFYKLSQLKYIEAVIYETLRVTPQTLTIIRTNNKEVDVSNIKKNSNLSFGTGLRICPGRFQAINMLKTLIFLLYLNYHVELVDPHSPIKNEFTFVNICLSGKVYVRPRNAE